MKSKTIILEENGKQFIIKTTDPGFLFDESKVVDYYDTDSIVKKIRPQKSQFKTHTSLKDFEAKRKLTKSEEKVQ